MKERTKFKSGGKRKTAALVVVVFVSFYPHFLTALLSSSSPSLCAPSTSRSKHMAPGASSPTKALGQRSIASMFSNSDRFAKAGGGGRAPRLPLMEFLARKLDKRSVSSIHHQVRFSLFPFICSLSLSLSLCAFASSGFPFPLRKN
jgi:hypothetical protein